MELLKLTLEDTVLRGSPTHTKNWPSSYRKGHPLWSCTQLWGDTKQWGGEEEVCTWPTSMIREELVLHFKGKNREHLWRPVDLWTEKSSPKPTAEGFSALLLWTSGPDNSLLWGANWCFVGCLAESPGLGSLGASKPLLWQLKIYLNISKDLLGRQNCLPHEKHSPSGSYT